ncbi:hypothetical protein [Embleya sp. NPDC050493]|uniref:hypothetical protein n=1 Tax=Embleya sp. NPDC050493 TaxID=3363989 RepID=UPI00378EA39C
MQIVTVGGRRWITVRELERLTAAAVDVAAHTPGCAILHSLPGRGRLTDAASTEVITTLVAVQAHPAVRSGVTDIAHAAAARLAAIQRSGEWVPAHGIGTGPQTRMPRTRSASHEPVLAG